MKTMWAAARVADHLRPWLPPSRVSYHVLLPSIVYDEPGVLLHACLMRHILCAAPVCQGVYQRAWAGLLGSDWAGATGALAARAAGRMQRCRQEREARSMLWSVAADRLSVQGVLKQALLLLRSKRAGCSSRAHSTACPAG